MKTETRGELLAERARNALWNALRSGELRGGQFVSVSQLVTMLDCPISAVREAVKHASVLGVVDTLPKRGVRVMEVEPRSIRDCLEFRLVLDQEGARRRVGQAAQPQLAELKRAHEGLRSIAKDDIASAKGLNAIEVDLSLHDYLAGALTNAHLQRSYEANRLRIAIIQRARPFLQDRICSAMEEHLAIISALEAGDADQAVEALRAHHDQTLRWWGVV